MQKKYGIIKSRKGIKVKGESNMQGFNVSRYKSGDNLFLK